MNLINFDEFYSIINELSNDYADTESITNEIIDRVILSDYYEQLCMKMFNYEFYFTVIDEDKIEYNFCLKIEDEENE
jgi:hypothetical protein